jgi:hypothetical protein
MKICYSETDDFCRPVKIRASAISKAARSPQYFAAGFMLNEPRSLMRSLESPLPLPRPARKLREPIDWRICGEQDMNLEVCR